MSAHDFQDLSRHVGHDVLVVQYAHDGLAVNAAVECETCNEVLMDFDAEGSIPAYQYPSREWIEEAIELEMENNGPDWAVGALESALGMLPDAALAMWREEWCCPEEEE